MVFPEHERDVTLQKLVVIAMLPGQDQEAHDREKHLLFSF